MTGFNMPPGCSVSDIPGNRPEDAQAEAFYDAFFEAEEAARKQHGTGDAYVEALANWAWEMMGKAFQEGYTAAQSDEAMAKDWKQWKAKRR